MIVEFINVGVSLQVFIEAASVYVRMYNSICVAEQDLNQRKFSLGVYGAEKWVSEAQIL